MDSAQEPNLGLNSMSQEARSSCFSQFARAGRFKGQKKKAMYEMCRSNDENTELFILKTKQPVGWHDLADLFFQGFSINVHED